MSKPISRVFIYTLFAALLISMGVYFNSNIATNTDSQQVVRLKHELLVPEIKQRSSASPHAAVEAKKARSEYFENLYRDPETGVIPAGAGIFDLEIAKEIDQNAPARKSNVTLSWDHAGPNNVGGRTRALAADKDNPDVLLAGAVAGGIWKSEDSGQSWRQVANTNLLPGITSIAQDPRPGFRNNWYAVGGEHDGSSTPFSSTSGAHYNTGYLESNDGGESWTYKDMFLLGQGVGSSFRWTRFGLNSRVVVHPSTGQLFIATNGFGVHRTGGQARILQETLESQLFPRYSDVNVNPNGVLIQYISGLSAGNADYTPGFFVSWDNGRFWNPIEIPGFDASDKRRAVIEFSHSNPNLAYALIQDANGELDSGVDEVILYRFTLDPANLSVSAQDVSTFLPDQIAANDEDLGRLAFNVQGNYNIALAIHPANPNMVFIGLTNLYRVRNINANVNISNNTALKDVVIGGYGIDSFFYNNQHPDHHLMIFPDPENRPDYMIAANDGGVYSTTNVQKAGEVDWSDLNFGYNVTQFYHASIPPREGQNQFSAGAQDNGTPFVLIDHSSLASQSLGDVSSGDGSFSYIGPDFIYTSSQNGRLLRYSLEQGPTVDGINFGGFSYPSEFDGFLANSTNNPGDEGRSFIHPFAVDRANHNVMYYPAGSTAGAGYQIFRNTQITNSIATASAAHGKLSRALIQALSLLHWLPLRYQPIDS